MSPARLTAIACAILLAAIAAGCAPGEKQNSPQTSTSSLGPKEVVEGYFQAFEGKDYSTMYSLISDGFKKAEPTASSYENFTMEIAKFYEVADGIKLKGTGEPEINGDTATVSYTISVLMKSGDVKPFESTYTLKKRANGWKLIHPYGSNIDAS